MKKVVRLGCGLLSVAIAIPIIGGSALFMFKWSLVIGVCGLALLGFALWNATQDGR